MDTLRLEHPHIPPTTLRNIFPVYHPSSIDFIVSFNVLPSEHEETQRSGHLLVSGLVLDTGYKLLQPLVDQALQAKAKRSMFAETLREREEMIESIRTCVWNVATNPVTVKTSCEEVVSHDFSTG